MLLPRFVRHHHVDIVGLVAVSLRESLIRAIGRIWRAVKAGHVARSFTNGPAARAVGFVHHVVRGLASAPFGILPLTLAFQLLVSCDGARGVFCRAREALAESRGFLTDCVVLAIVHGPSP